MAKTFQDSLHTSAKARLKELINRYLSDIQIEKDDPFFYSFENKFGEHEIIDKITKLLKSEHFGYFEVYDFLRNEIKICLDLLDESEEFNNLLYKGDEFWLNKIVNLEKLSETMFNKLLRFPINYFLLIPLHTVKLPSDTPIKISNEISIIKMNEELLTTLPPLVKRSPLLGANSPERDIVYIRILFEGYVRHVLTHESPSVKLAQRTIKKLIAALIVSGIFVESSYLMRLFEKVSSPPPCYIYPLMDTDEESQSIALLELSFIDKLSLHESIYDFFKKEPNFLEQIVHIQKISDLFSIDSQNQETKDEIERVLTSLEWYIDGIFNKNETFSFILFFTAIEALLGDPNRKENIVDRLSDRWAYLLSKNSAKRKSLKKDFNKGKAEGHFPYMQLGTDKGWFYFLSS